jgi:hypothetical protein
MWYRTYDLDTESNSRLVDLTTSTTGIIQQNQYTNVYFHGFVPEATGTFSTLRIRANDISVTTLLNTAIRTFGAIYTAAEVTTTSGNKEWFPNILLGYGGATSSSLPSDMDHAFIDVDLGFTGYPAVTRGEMYYVGLFFTSNPISASYSSFNIYGSNISAATQQNNHLAFSWPWRGHTPAGVPTTFPTTITSTSSGGGTPNIVIGDAHADGCFWFQLSGPQTAAGATQGPTGPTGPAGGGTSTADLVAMHMTVLSDAGSVGLGEWSTIQYLGRTNNNTAYDYFTQTGSWPGLPQALDTNALCWLSPVAGFHHNVRFEPVATPQVGAGALSTMTVGGTNSDPAWIVARQDGSLVGYGIEGFQAYNNNYAATAIGPGLRGIPIFAGVISTSAGGGAPFLATLTGSLSTRGNVGGGPLPTPFFPLIESGIELFTTQTTSTSGAISFQAGDLIVCCYGPSLGYAPGAQYPYPQDTPQVVTLYVDYS